MPEGKTIPYQEGEYPQLDGLKPGSSVSFEGKGRIGDGGLEILSMDFNPDENAADREMQKMAGDTRDLSGSAPAGFDPKAKGTGGF